MQSSATYSITAQYFLTRNNALNKELLQSLLSPVRFDDETTYKNSAEIHPLQPQCKHVNM